MFLYLILSELILQHVDPSIDKRTGPRNSITPDSAMTDTLVQDNSDHDDNHIEVTTALNTNSQPPSIVIQPPLTIARMSLDNGPLLLRDLQSSVESQKPVTMSNMLSLDTSPLNLSHHPSYDRDFYQYGWFRGAIVLAVLFISHPIIYGIVFSPIYISSQVDLVLQFPYWLVPEIVSLTLYVALFLVLEDFQQPITRFLEDRMRLPSSTQRRLKAHLHIYLGTLLVLLVIFLLLWGTLFGWRLE